MSRTPVSDEALLKAIEIVTHHVGLRIEKHGRGAFASNHEALGVTTEEYFELVEAVKNNDEQNVAEELVDIAVCGIFGLASKIKMEAVSVPDADETETGSGEQLSSADHARQMMIDRAAKSGLYISPAL